MREGNDGESKKRNVDDRFYREHEAKLFAYLMRLTGEYYTARDLLQESFTRYLERYDDRPRSVPLLYAIARNAFVDACRRRRKEAPPVDDAESDDRDNPEHRLLVREKCRQVTAAMDALGEKERETLSLAVTGDLSYREIAGILGITEANVKVRVHRARMKLLKHLGKGETDE